MMEGDILQMLNSRQREILANSKQNEFQWLRKDPQNNSVKYQKADIKFKEDNRFFKHKQYAWLCFSYVVTQIQEEQQSPEFQFDVSSLNLTMELYAFKEPDTTDHFTSDPPSFSGIKLFGNTMAKIENQTTSITGVKFVDTSFNQKGLKFGLVFLLKNDKQEIIDFRISPLIFVESRKKSHQERVISSQIVTNYIYQNFDHNLDFEIIVHFKKKQKQTEYSIFDPFLPEHLDKNYVKVNPKNPEVQIIKEDFEGVLNYFTAYSIRHKVIKYIKPLNGPIISFSPTLLADIPSNFVELKYLDELKEIYKRSYTNLASQKIQMSLPNDDESIKENNLQNDDNMDLENQNEESIQEYGQGVDDQLNSFSNSMVKGTDLVRNESLSNLQKMQLENNRNNGHINMKDLCSSLQKNSQRQQQGLNFQRTNKFDKENARRTNHSSLEKDIESSQINQEAPAECIRSTIHLNQFTSEKRKKLHKLPVYFGRNNSNEKQSKRLISPPIQNNDSERMSQLKEKIQNSQQNILSENEMSPIPIKRQKVNSNEQNIHDMQQSDEQNKTTNNIYNDSNLQNMNQPNQIMNSYQIPFELQKKNSQSNIFSKQNQQPSQNQQSQQHDSQQNNYISSPNQIEALQNNQQQQQQKQQYLQQHQQFQSPQNIQQYPNQSNNNCQEEQNSNYLQDLNQNYSQLQNMQHQPSQNKNQILIQQNKQKNPNNNLDESIESPSNFTQQNSIIYQQGKSEKSKMSEQSSQANSVQNSLHNLSNQYIQNKNNANPQQERGRKLNNNDTSSPQTQVQSFPTFQNLKSSNYKKQSQSPPGVQQQQQQSINSEINPNFQNSSDQIVPENINNKNDSNTQINNNPNSNQQNIQMNYQNNPTQFMNNFNQFEQQKMMQDQTPKMGQQPYFNPFYCFMLQQQQILQLQQSYIQELKKNAELLRQQSQSQPSSNNSYHHKNLKNDGSNCSSNNVFDQQMIGSSSDSQQIQSPDINQYTNANQSPFLEKDMSFQNNGGQKTPPSSSNSNINRENYKIHSKSSRFAPYIPTNNQLEELYNRYLQMANTSVSSNNISTTTDSNVDSSKNSIENSEKDKSNEGGDSIFGRSESNSYLSSTKHQQSLCNRHKNNNHHHQQNNENRYYFQNILLPLFKNINAYILRDQFQSPNKIKNEINKMNQQKQHKEDKNQNLQREKKKQSIERNKDTNKENKSKQNNAVTSDVLNNGDQYENQFISDLNKIGCYQNQPQFKSQSEIPEQKNKSEETSNGNSNQENNNNNNEQSDDENSQNDIEYKMKQNPIIEKA